MPKRYTVFNPEGEDFVSDRERLNQSQQAMNSSDALARQALAQRQMELAQQRELAGTFKERSEFDRSQAGEQFANQRAMLGDEIGARTGLARMQEGGQNYRAELQDTGATERTKLGIQPQMTALGYGKEKDDREWNAGAGRRTVEDAKYGVQGGILRQIGAAVNGEMGGAGVPGQPQGNALGLKPSDMRGLAFTALGGSAPVDRDDEAIHAALSKMLETADPSDVPAIIEATKSGDYSKIPTNNQGKIARISNEVGNLGVASDVEGALQRVHKFIRSNNWGIGDANRVELRQMYRDFMDRLDTLGASPSARAMLEDKLKQTMRDALHENGAFFEAAGSDQTRQEFRL